MVWLLTFLLLLLSSLSSAQSSVPHSGIGTCPSGQVVNRLNPNAGPGCIPASGAAVPINLAPNQSGDYNAHNFSISGVNALSIKSLNNNTQFADQFNGATFDVKVAACLAALPASGGRCDAQGLTGAQSLVATITVPANDVLTLGAMTLTATVLPVFKMSKNTGILGLVGINQLATSGTTTINLSGTGAGSIIASNGTSALYGVTIENLVLNGLSNSDGSIAIDLQNISQANVSHNIITNVQTGIRLGGNANTTQANLSDNWLGGSLGVGEDYQQNANNSISTHDAVHSTSATQGWKFESGSVADVVDAPDCESLTVGDCIDLAGTSVTIRDLYAEASKGGIFLESTATKTLAWGTGNASSMGADGALNYGSAEKIDNVIVWLNGNGAGGIPIYPQYWGAFNYYLGLPNGSQPNYYTLLADSLGSGQLWMEPSYTAGGSGETSVGLTGHAGMSVGSLKSTGGNALKGFTSTATLATPSGLTCTPTCASSCSTTYSYAVVCDDFNTGKTLKSSTVTCSNNATLDSVNNFNTLSWTKEEGCQKWDIVGNLDTSHSVATNVSVTIPGSISSPGTTYSYKDFSNSPSSYTLPSRNTTSDASFAGFTSALADRDTPVTLATLPTCTSTTEGTTGVQSDSTAACSPGATATTGGTTHCQVFCNGTNYIQTGIGLLTSAQPINLLPSQTSTYHAATQGFDQLGNMTADTGSAHALQYFDTNGALNVRAHGAVANGSTCDDPAIQNTINAACAASTSTIIPMVYLPSGNYKTCQPLIMTCGNSGALTLRGDDHNTTAITPNFTGPAIAVVRHDLSSTLGTIVAAPLVGSTGHSLFWTSSPDPFWLDLQEDLGTTTTPFLNGKSAMTMRVFFNTPTSGRTMAISFSAGQVDYWKAGGCAHPSQIGSGSVGICLGAYGAWLDTDNKLHCYFTTSNNGTVYASSSGTFTTSAVQEADCEYDGAHIGAALGGTWGSLVAATGTLVQRPDEIATLGALVAYWPHLTTQPIPFSGSLFDPEIATVARRTLGTNYTQDTSSFTFDANTIYGSAFSQIINMPSPDTGGAVFGADYFRGSATTSTWAMIHNYGPGCCGGHYNIDHININSGSVGVDVLATDVSLTHLKLSNQTYIGIDTSPNATYNSNFDDIRGIGNSSEMGQVVIEGGIAAATRIYTNACGQLCDYIANGSFRDMYAAAASNTQWGIVCAQGCSLSDVIDDNENGGACSAVTFEGSPVNGATAFVIDDNSQIGPCNSSISPITLEATNNGSAAIPITIRDSNLTWFAPAPAAIIHEFVGGGSTPPLLTFTSNSYTSGLTPSIAYNDGPATLNVQAGGHTIFSAGTDWPLPQSVTNNEQFFCNSCDPPTNPMTICTKTGSPNPGAEVHGVNGQWLCGSY